MALKQAKTPGTRGILTFGLYLSISMSSCDNMVQNYITNCIPCPLLHNILLPVAAVLLGAFWFKLLFKLQTPTEKVKFSVAICVDTFSNCDGKKKQPTPKQKPAVSNHV